MRKEKIKGTIVYKGIITGNAKVISNFSQIGTIEEGDIMVVKNSHPMYAVGVMKAGGLICDEGSVTSHICTIAMEIGIPCITQTVNATEKLDNNEAITLDANTGVVY